MVIKRHAEALFKRAIQSEMTGHLGYGRLDAISYGSGGACQQP